MDKKKVTSGVHLNLDVLGALVGGEVGKGIVLIVQITTSPFSDPGNRSNQNGSQ